MARSKRRAQKKPDISIIITAHREGALAGVTANSARKAIAFAATSLGLESNSAWGNDLRKLVGKLGFDQSEGAGHYHKARRFIFPLFSAAHYRRTNKLDATVSDMEAFLRYVTYDLPAGTPPGPLFSPEYYLEELTRLGLPLPKRDEPPFLHWLYQRAPEQISPCPAYSNEDYLQLNPDIAAFPGGPFEHFLLHGIHEGRRFSRLTVVATNAVAMPLDDGKPRILQFCETLSAAAPVDGGLSEMRAFFDSGCLDKTVLAAVEDEPDIGGINSLIHSMIPPWHDQAYVDYSRVAHLVPTSPVDNLVLMPFCKMGGADFVAGVLTQTLNRNGTTLVLRTDSDDWERPDWFPPEVETIDLSAELVAMSDVMRMRTLYELIVRLRPKAVFNVNSRLAFDTFKRYGERLSLLTRLYAYYFCADRTPDGVEVGYPVWYFSNILPFLSGALIDNATLANQLIERFSLSGGLRDKVRTIYTPAMSPISKTTVAERQVCSASKRRRKRVLWAGRLDTQKRFGLVQSIARRMPRVDFDCWGKAVLDAPPDVSDLPPNLKLHEPFKIFDDLPLEDADGWLYTSDWDGIPTILIELAALGVPIVASAVGGVPELIDETTGWPMDAEATVTEYVDTIQAMLDDPEARVSRASSLQERARRLHSTETYSNAVSSLIPNKRKTQNGTIEA